MKDNTSYVNEAVISYTPKKICDQSLTTPEVAESFLRGIWNAQIGLKESFYVVAVNNSAMAMSYYMASIGGANATVVELVDIMRFLILSGASKFFIAHNHPCSQNKASMADIRITKKIQESAEILGLELMDHLILFPENGFYSFRNHNLI